MRKASKKARTAPEFRKKAKRPPFKPAKKSASRLKLKMTKSRKTPRHAKAKALMKKGKAAKRGKPRSPARQITVQPAPVPLKRELSKEMVDILARAQARQWLVELGGENTLEVIKNLCAVPGDEELAKKLKVKVSDVRASLNKLHNEGLVAYMRDKNSETGWYSYSWAINEEKIKKWLLERQARTESFRPRVGVDLYFCKCCGPERALRFEIATEHSFKCPDCNAPLDLLDEEKFEQILKAMEGKGR